MRIVLIGAGNLATNLGKALHNAGHDIVQVYSHTWEHAQQLATVVGGAATCQLDEIVDTADIYIFSIKDSALAEVIPQVTKGKEGKLMIHTSGSMPIDCFEGMANSYGVLYPMQTFSKARETDFRVIPCFIEGCDDVTTNRISALAETISDRVYYMSTADRKYLHLAAVWACNFVNHCYTVSAKILKEHNVPFDVMLPLIDETAAKVHEMEPVDAQTGPAVRFDENVIRNQKNLMRDNPVLMNLYERMSMSIHATAEANKKEQEE